MKYLQKYFGIFTLGFKHSSVLQHLECPFFFVFRETILQEKLQRFDFTTFHTSWIQPTPEISLKQQIIGKGKSLFTLSL